MRDEIIQLIEQFIVNELGINLCSVKEIKVNRQDDKQITDIYIEFTPNKAIHALEQMKEGHWNLYHEGRYDESYVCSECDGYSMFDYKYCPNCGARMG